MQLSRNVDALRTMRHALATSDAMVSLPQTRHTPVIPYQESTARLPVVLFLRTFRHVALIDALVIMYQNRRYINAVRTRHAIFAIIAGHSGILHHQVCRVE